MKKYNVEGISGFDFYSELNNGDSDEGEDANKNDSENNPNIANNANDIYSQNNKCLITGEKLIDRFVTLKCNHSFNYVPLYKDIVNHKTKFNIMESTMGCLNKDEIRCPYCRQKQKGYLPYYADMDLKKVDGVNWMAPSFDLNTSGHHTCCYTTPNELFNKDLPECNETNIKNIKCECYGHYQLVFFESEAQDNKVYCYDHKKIMMRKYKLDMKAKEKEAAKTKKLKEKEDLKKAKEEMKLQAKLAKIASKIKISKETGENVVLSSSSSSSSSSSTDFNNVLLCTEILKSGPRKGSACCLSVFEQQELCKRHYNLLKKVNST